MVNVLMAQAAPSTENKASLDEVPLVGKTMAFGSKGGMAHPQWHTDPLLTTSPDISEFELPAPGQPPYTRGIHENMYRSRLGPRDNTPGFRVQK